MTPRLSLRAQIAVALAAALLIGGLLNGFVSLALTQRAAREELRPFTRALARQLDHRGATLGERVEDVFFVTNANNQPLSDPQLCTQLQQALIAQLQQENEHQPSPSSFTI